MVEVVFDEGGKIGFDNSPRISVMWSQNAKHY